MSAYREPGVPSSAWFKTSKGNDAIRISEIIMVAYNPGNKDFPYSILFRNIPSMNITETEGLRLLGLLE